MDSGRQRFRFPFQIVLALLCLVALVCASHDELPKTGDKVLVNRQSSGSTWWLANIPRNGRHPFNPNSTYAIFRNVKDYGAVGDGIADDTAALNRSIADGNRCGYGCDSSTTVPALVYVPPGTYRVTGPVVMYYMTQLIGDATNLPVIKADPNFQGLGVLDADPYVPGGGGANWYANQNNFYRQVRNFIIDITDMPINRGAGLHWQVAQATSLQNIVFNMRVGGTTNKQQGIFMDNGSGGFMSDLVFNGGNIGFYSGNQQFTGRNMTFNNCQTGIYQNWAWIWAYKDIVFNNCTIGVDMTSGGGVAQQVGSALLQDSVYYNTQVGVLTTWSSNSTPIAGGTLVLDNVDFTGALVAVQHPNRTVIVPGRQRVASYVQGRVYSAYDGPTTTDGQTCYGAMSNSSRIQQTLRPPPKPAGLLDSAGRIFSRSKPQYENVPYTSFVSVKSRGARGNGVDDDTLAIQAVFDTVLPNQIVYFDYGAYVVSNTINIPRNIKIVGELWPLIMVKDTLGVFSDMRNPRVAFRVGNPGDVGNVEMVDLVFETIGPAPGCIMMEWNLAGTTPGAAGMWDVHFRIGGTAGTQLQADRCLKTPTILTTPDPNCFGVFLMLHVTRTASAIFENNWAWVSDHELDIPPRPQINIYTGRGILIESQNPVWFTGSGSEHCVLYNYQVANARNLYMSIIQSETAYMQDNPNSLTPYPRLPEWNDPTFQTCYQALCYKTWGLRVIDSTDILIYGAGLYSFFQNYNTGCLLTTSCQEVMVEIVRSEGIHIYALNTVGTQNMVQIDGVKGMLPYQQTVNTFCNTVALFEYA